MKRFSKFMLSVAAVSAVTAAMAVSASAALEVNYDEAAGTVTVTGIESTGASQTMLIVAGDATTTADSTNIKAINQADQEGDVEGSFNDVAIPVQKLADGTYEVRFGGTTAGTIQRKVFTVGDVIDEPTVVLVGDVNGSGTITTDDATGVLRHVVGLEKLEGDALLQAAYCTGDYIVTTDDATNILRFVVGLESGNAGKTMEIPAQQ